MHYLEAAKRRFPGHCVGGAGRYALYAPAAGPLSKILLYETFREASNQILDPKHARVVDLAVDGDALLAKIPDRHYEREGR
jgi:hypothetical protein